ncbi:hypothetical protein AaE_012828 [Aphanomyces astaci]|uniref:Sfi1 spindle body domain-containing protein n=1 Tax=Aphanomyces astaci TaxID=112090 RepID=A0A6A4ZDW7_APHAT|nr:hypothetical protein AaE_012828 [Aphanomyces astaci]
MWHLQRRIWSAWRSYVRQIVHARAVAAAKAAAAWQHRADLDATVHYRKATLFKTFVQWNTFTKRSKAVKHAASGFVARQSRTDRLLAQVLRPNMIEVELETATTTTKYSTSCTSPSLPPLSTVSCTKVPRRPWKSAKRPPPPPQRGSHMDVATSPRKLRVRVPRTAVVQDALPPRILDMRAREAERKLRWEALQTKYKEAQLAREEAARVAAAQALADVQQQKAAAAALKLERKRYNNHFNPGVRDMSVIFNNDREMAREEAEKAQRRQLAVEQWTLAKRHHLRALVLFQGWRPWRHLAGLKDNVSIIRTKAIKAKHWHHDTTLHQRFGAWVGYRDACRAQARAIRTARLRAAATWYDKRWLHRVMLQWQVQKC